MNIHVGSGTGLRTTGSRSMFLGPSFFRNGHLDPVIRRWLSAYDPTDVYIPQGTSLEGLESETSVTPGSSWPLFLAIGVAAYFLTRK